MKFKNSNELKSRYKITQIKTTRIKTENNVIEITDRFETLEEFSTTHENDYSMNKFIVFLFQIFIKAIISIGSL
jgi:hypothetical protein